MHSIARERSLQSQWVMDRCLSEANGIAKLCVASIRVKAAGRTSYKALLGAFISTVLAFPAFPACHGNISFGRLLYSTTSLVEFYLRILTPSLIRDVPSTMGNGAEVSGSEQV